MTVKKQLISILISCLFYGIAIGQINDSLPKDVSIKDLDNQIKHYMNKSNKQKKWAWPLLGGGLLLNTVGVAVEENNPETVISGSAILTSIGGAAALNSIPVFFASSKNRNKAQMFVFEKNLLLATSDSSRTIYLRDAATYFSGRAKANSTAAIVLSVVGGGFVIAGIVMLASDNSDSFIPDPLLGPFFLATGISFALISIPFHVRAAKHKNTSRLILSTGRIPNSTLGSSSVTTFLGGSRYLSIGMRVEL